MRTLEFVGDAARDKYSSMRREGGPGFEHHFRDDSGNVKIKSLQPFSEPEGWTVTRLMIDQPGLRSGTVLPHWVFWEPTGVERKFRADDLRRMSPAEAAAIMGLT